MKRKLLIYKLSVFVMLLFMGMYSYAQTGLIISEVADPADHYDGRFVQLFNPTSESIDLDAGNWYLSRQSNGGTTWGDIKLTGTIDAGKVYLVAYDSALFNSYYGFDANQASGNISGNGDDGYFLYQGGDHTAGTLVDAYGVLDHDGTGEAWEYTDGKAVRNSDIGTPNTTWTASEWTITSPANVADMDPANHTYNAGGDVTAPQWTTGYPQATRVEDTRATLLVNLDEPAAVYFIVVPAGSDAPTADEVKAGVDYGTVTVSQKDTITVDKADETVAYELTGVQVNTSIDIYFVAEDAAGNLQSDPVKLTVTTTEARSLTITEPAANTSFNIGDTINVKWDAANIDSLLVGVYPVAEGLGSSYLVGGPVSTADGGYSFVVPQEAEARDYGIVLWDYYDTTFRERVSTITVVDNRTLTMTKPQDGDTLYLGDTLVVCWTSSNVDSVLIGGYISEDGPDGGYFMLTGDPDHFDESSFRPVAASDGCFKMYLDPDEIGGSVKIDSLIIWNAAYMPMKAYALNVVLLDTSPLHITHSVPSFGMTDYINGNGIYAEFNCDSIVPGTGNLYVKKDDGTVVATIAPSDLDIHGSSFWVSMSKDLDPGGSYYIEVDSGFVKSYGEDKVYPGLKDKSWNFTVASTSIYFSEYVEGSGNNKALEVYNPTGEDVNLDDYVIASSYNGYGLNDEVYHFPEGTVLHPGDVFVLANEDADSAVLSVANDTLRYNEGGYVCSFNGDDARILMKVVNNGYDHMWVDVIGEPWTDPGDGWEVAGVANATKDHTLLRKSTVKIGCVDWTMSAGTDADNSEWIVKDEDYFENLGEPTPSGISVTFNANMSYAQNFDPKKDSVYIAGTFPDANWNEPGTNPALRMSDADSNGIYTITITFPSAQEVQYKYFINAGWGGGEWDGGDNRKIDIAHDTTVNDLFGYIDNQPPMVVENVPYKEDFEGVTDGDALNLKGWTNVNTATGGALYWLGKEYNSNKYAQVSAYKSPSTGADTVWLITPAINLDNSTDEKLSFDINVGYWKHNGLKVLLSTDYDQTADGIQKATWTDVTSSFTIPTEPTSGYGTFASAGTLDISGYSGNLSIAFVYTGDAANGETTTYQIDNVTVEGTTTGIANIGLSDKVQLYPNPGNGIFNIATNGILKGAVTMRVVDVTGRLVLQKRFEQIPSTVKVDISAQPANIYFITLTGENATIVKKFMKR